jgi:hypothetical protein
VLVSAAAAKTNLAAFAKDVAVCSGRRAACGISLLQPTRLPLQLWWHAYRVYMSPPRCIRSNAIVNVSRAQAAVTSSREER